MYVYKCSYPNGMSYIGATTRSPSKSLFYYGSHPKLKQDLKSMDRSLIVKTIIAETEHVSVLEDIELKAIVDHNAVRDSSYYNTSYNTEMVKFGTTQSEQTKQLISEGNTGHKHDDRARQRMSNNNIFKRDPLAVLKMSIEATKRNLTKSKGVKKAGNKFQPVFCLYGEQKYLPVVDTEAEAHEISVRIRKQYLACLNADLIVLAA